MKKKTEEQWKKDLSPEQYLVCRQKGTEPPFTGKYTHNKEEGQYFCVGCDQPLFTSETKYDSGSGWPSFFSPVSPDSIRLEKDFSHGMHRVEVLCNQCESHLGHVFEDGPAPTGKRFCINSLALTFKAKK